MAKTGEVLLGEFSDFVGDTFADATSSAGASDGSTVIGESMRRYSEDTIEGWYLRIDHSGHGAQHRIRRITSFADSNGAATVAPNFGTQIGSGVNFELHRYDPARKFAALDRARFKIVEDVFSIVRNDLVTSDGRNEEYRIPSAFSRGPRFAVVECPLETDAEWNLLSYPKLDTLTSWTAAGGFAASQFSRGNIDDVIPKYDENCTKIVYTDGGSDGTYTQVVADMDSNFSAARSAGRTMEAGMWVYCTESGGVVEIVRDGGSVTSSAHQGLGWEFLRARGEIPQANATLLSVRFRIPTSGTARVAYLNRAWLAYDNIPQFYDDRTGISTLYDDSLKRFWLQRGPAPRGYQIRLFGKEPLSALGTTLATASTNTMEVDDSAAQILYAEAAKLLFGDDLFNSEDLQGVAEKIQWVDLQRKELAMSFPFNSPRGRIRGPYSQ